MKEYGIHITGYFNDNSESLFIEFEKEVKKFNIVLYRHNLTGEMYHSVVDFMDLEKICFGYELIQSLIYSGAYDIFKLLIFKLWNIMQNKRMASDSLTIEIGGIPTINGPENIRYKIVGELSDKQKTKVIDKTFDLAKEIKDNQFKLMERSIYYDAINAHVFKYNFQKESFAEVNIQERVEQIMSKDK